MSPGKFENLFPTRLRDLPVVVVGPQDGLEVVVLDLGQAPLQVGVLPQALPRALGPGPPRRQQQEQQRRRQREQLVHGDRVGLWGRNNGMFCRSWGGGGGAFYTRHYRSLNIYAETLLR